jgi:hypothetical protein
MVSGGGASPTADGQPSFFLNPASAAAPVRQGLAPCYRSLVALSCVAVPGFAGSMSYVVTQNPSACHEVHLGVLTKPPEINYVGDVGVNVSYCHLEIRAAGETELYLAAACQFDTPHSQTFPLTAEKYAVDLDHPNKVRRIAEQTWQSTMPLRWVGPGGIEPTRPTAPGISYRGHIFEKSGPKWSGVGAGPIGAPVSVESLRVAVNSWDGLDIRYDFLDPTVLFQNDKVKGEFWTDIYDVASGQRLIQIQGSFDGADPGKFLGYAVWYGTRYYVMPVGKTSWLGTFNLRRLLICDADAAARMNGSGLKQRE